jgi:hypothetical protein
MKINSKGLLIASLFAATFALTGCGPDSPSGSSGSSSSSSEPAEVSLKPKTHNASYADTCHVQTATQYQAADVRYNQYEECMYTYAGTSEQAACEGYYTNYQSQVQLAEQTRTSIGC